MERTYQTALREAGTAQTWPGHFLFKRIETELLLGQAGIAPEAVGLELGCGNAFQSALLALHCRWLVSSDLLEPDPRTHTVGLDKAQTLLDRCGVRNVTLMAASADALPFPDGTFDFVISSSVLEHVARRPEAVREMFRVLKPGGQMILAVPTHIASLCAFPHAALYLGVRAVQIFTRRIAGGAPSSGESVPSARRAADDDRRRTIRESWTAFWRHHPSFPFPEPHGTYASVFDELRAQFPHRWRALLEAGGFQLERSFALTLVPISLLEVFSPSLMARCYARSKGLHERVAAHPAAQAVAYIWAAVCRKGTPAPVPSESRFVAAVPVAA